MIPESAYPELTILINQLPQLFQHCEVIGVFLGNEICASIMHNAALLEKIRFYDNLSFTDDTDLKQEFLKLYQEWQNEIPNLEVLTVDGRNFDPAGTFIYHDMNMTLYEFYTLYGDKLKNKLLANCCYGTNLFQTIQYSRFITDKLIYPVLLYRDILFYTFDYASQQIYHNAIYSFLINSELEFEINNYVVNDIEDKQMVRLLNTENYHDRAKDFMENNKT